jgi:hypothetical protein
MIHRISLAECLDACSPPAKVLDIAVLDDTVFVYISALEQDSHTEKHTEQAEISVSLPSLLEALALLANDSDREHLRPSDTPATKETRLSGRRLTVVPVAPHSAVAALTDHLRYTARPESGKDGSGGDCPIRGEADEPDR